MAHIVPFQRKAALRDMVCQECGVVGTASCDCGAPYIPAAARAALAVAANPQMSDRAIGADIGVSGETVRRARKATATDVAVEKRVGLDGKARQLPKKPSASKARRIVDEVDEEIDNQASATMRRRLFLRFAEDVLRKVEQGAGLKFAKASEIDRAILSTLDDIVRAWSKLRDEITQRSQHG